ncbi:MAG: enoyl-CoA hydratase-related protein [Verrucomicrobiota bacterium JB022]|nr:enoyl-CoA hydratase-related protein [Verrucomicrobiota bacterium JB022]
MPEIEIAKAEGVLEIQIARPQKKNALTSAMYAALADAFTAAAEDPSVKVVCIRGAQGVFTAGNDLGDFLNHPPQDGGAPVFRFIEAAAFFPKPLVAVVEGLAVGIGTTLLLHCDYVLAAPDTRFILPFVNLGLSPEAASSYLLPLRAGHALAAELLLLGRPFDAATAQRAGLVNAIVPAEELTGQAQQRCRQLAAQPAAALRATKRLLKQPYVDGVRAALKAEQELFLERLASPEAREAFAAFAEKRAPDFSRFS